MSPAEYITFTLLMLAILLVLARLVRGPSLAHRVVAMDLLTTIGVGIIAAYAISTKQPVYLDVAIVLALIAFLGTIAFAYYLERRGR